MTIPKEVRERIEREAREESELVCFEIADIPTEEEGHQAAGYAACYVKLKCEEWVREQTKRNEPCEHRFTESQGLGRPHVCVECGTEV